MSYKEPLKHLLSTIVAPVGVICLKVFFYMT